MIVYEGLVICLMIQLEGSDSLSFSELCDIINGVKRLDTALRRLISCLGSLLAFQIHDRYKFGSLITSICEELLSRPNHPGAA
jgi:hypothetical protein